MRKFIFTLALVSTVVSEESFSQDRSQARSMVISQNGIVAAEHPLAAQAGAMILSHGGHAVDAAVAANAVMGLVAPMSNGIGGDLFAIVYEAKSGKLFGLNASGWAPKMLSVDFLKNKGLTTMPYRGIHSVTVPGAVDGWDKLLLRFGRLKFAEILSPAIRYAEEGFPVTELVSGLWKANERLLQENPIAAKTFLMKDQSPAAGEVFRNSDLAWSYKQIAETGRDAFYKGEIAKRILAFSNREEGTLSAADLVEFSSEWVEPISTTYHRWTVYELPPNGQGIAALTMLNIMENFPLKEYGHNSTLSLHAMIEAKKLAYADMLTFVADPKFAKIPVQGILSKEYAQARSKLIDVEKASCSVGPGQPPIAMGNETIYLCVSDREGNMVSLIQSNYENFGSCLVADGTGFALQNRGALFSLDPKSPNVLTGRKRPLHTIIPAFMTKGDVRIAFGIMGGWNQSQAHAQFVSNVVDQGMNIQSALEAPRFTKRTFEGCDVQIEGRVLPQVRAELETKGHKMSVRGDFSGVMGGGQAVMRDFSKGINYGASDPRKDGAAIPEPIRRK
ncbi:MAG: gamma-glutamyltransferase [Ignavibacteriales bacterium]|nr:gamma-glutamyltransferase [Ignavibacteriales bacterium]